MKKIIEPEMYLARQIRMQRVRSWFNSITHKIAGLINDIRGKDSLKCDYEDEFDYPISPEEGYPSQNHY